MPELWSAEVKILGNDEYEELKAKADAWDRSLHKRLSGDSNSFQEVEIEVSSPTTLTVRNHTSAIYHGEVLPGSHSLYALQPGDTLRLMREVKLTVT